MSEAQRPIVIRRRRKVPGKKYSGGWKIALADFMTALMAVFLVLWLLSTASPAEMQGVSEYFRTPLSVAMTGGDKRTASTSAIPGGGSDPVHSEGEVSRIDLRTQTRPSDVRRRFTRLQQRLERAIAANPELRNVRHQIYFEASSEGLRIQLVDSDRRPMFELGSDAIAPYMRALLDTLAPLLNDLPNRLSISGHTDSIPFSARAEGYDNWELSSDRAHASRRELVKAGLDSRKLLRVTGMSDRVPVSGAAPGDPVNRRITITVLSAPAADRIRRRSGADVEGARIPDWETLVRLRPE